MGFVKEFKEFAVKGNALDMAVGLIIGAAFNKIVTSIVQDLIMPPIGMMLGRVDFKNLQLVLKQAAGDVPAVAVRYGAFINTVVEFVIVAFSVFMVVKFMNRVIAKREAPAAPK